jgi:predicted  nucleic acid-binding Zn-ribbon protein
MKEMLCCLCGEIYDANDPLVECCGECGSFSFVPKSKDPMKGFDSIEQYENYVRLIPDHLRNMPFPWEVDSQLEENLPE